MDTAIRNDLRTVFGLTVREETPVDGGWLNRKWKIRTEDGLYLVKQFSRERFRPHALAQIEDALVRQMTVREAGVPCPAIRTADGRPMRFLEDGTVYMVMTFCPGHMETPETVTAEAMRSLGETCGRMHRAFGGIPVENVKGYPIDGERLLAELAENCRARSDEAQSGTSAAYRAAAEAMKPVLDTLSAGFFGRLAKGIAHEDFSPDNMLFDGGRVSAVLDFDRNCYSFLLHDVGRALMSLAWNNGTLDLRKVRAFADGYAVHMPWSEHDLADALRITWCIESVWWIQAQFFGGCSPKVARFRDEILWLTEHWNELGEFRR